jgi:hypothetical protein
MDEYSWLISAGRYGTRYFRRPVLQEAMACDDLHQLDTNGCIVWHGCQSAVIGHDMLKDVIVLASVAMANELLNRARVTINAVQTFQTDVVVYFFKTICVSIYDPNFLLRTVGLPQPSTLHETDTCYVFFP